MSELLFDNQANAPLVFADEPISDPEQFLLTPEHPSNWTIMIVDDDEEVHNITKLILEDFEFQNKSLTFISAYSAQEAIGLMASHSETALILLDVVMETDDAGLSVVKYIRETLHNNLVRIVLRTGQPGQAPEETVIIEYDINDYRAKAELTARHLLTTVITSLRAYGHLQTLEQQRQELKELAVASARFVPQTFLRMLNKDSIINVALGDQVQQEMTIMFTDVRDFTTISETMTPRENFAFINSLLSQICPVIRQFGGFVDKYLGDGIMALFPNKADDAVQAAIAMRQQLAYFNEELLNKARLPVEMGIGLHSGLLMLGTIGEHQRMDGTVISDAVNLAARVEGLTKRYGANLVISEQTLMRLEDITQYSIRFVDKVQVKGKQATVAVFEVFDGDTETERQLKLATKTEFEQGLKLYHQKQFPEASVCFSKVLKQNSNDEAARLYLQRAAYFMVHGVPHDWAGIDILTEK